MGVVRPNILTTLPSFSHFCPCLSWCPGTLSVPCNLASSLLIGLSSSDRIMEGPSTQCWLWVCNNVRTGPEWSIWNSKQFGRAILCLLKLLLKNWCLYFLQFLLHFSSNSLLVYFLKILVCNTLGKENRCQSLTTKDSRSPLCRRHQKEFYRPQVRICLPRSLVPSCP